ncbi:MAG: hypothetical protein DRN27_05360 [Thermoplasmata archaeon]|nr:MAG: hypothetical protein DRN27_05360 [Thermoplasmata archaeon]
MQIVKIIPSYNTISINSECHKIGKFLYLPINQEIQRTLIEHLDTIPHCRESRFLYRKKFDINNNYFLLSNANTTLKTIICPSKNFVGYHIDVSAFKKWEINILPTKTCFQCGCEISIDLFCKLCGELSPHLKKEMNKNNIAIKIITTKNQIESISEEL